MRRAGEVDDFKKNINNVMKDLLGKFKDLQFYTGETFFYYFTHSYWWSIRGLDDIYLAERLEPLTANAKS